MRLRNPENPNKEISFTWARTRLFDKVSALAREVARREALVTEQADGGMEEEEGGGDEEGDEMED